MNVFSMPNFKIYSFVKKNSVMEFLVNRDGTLGTLQTVKCPCKPIILSIGYFQAPTEVQLNSWKKASSL